MRKLQETDTDNVHSCGIVYPEVYLYIKRISAIIPILELEAVFKSCSLVEDKPCNIDTETKLIVNATLSFVSYIFEIIFPNLYCNYCTLPSYAFHSQYSERNVNNLPGCYFMDDDCMMLFLPAAGRRWHMTAKVFFEKMTDTITHQRTSFLAFHMITYFQQDDPVVPMVTLSAASENNKSSARTQR